MVQCYDPGAFPQGAPSLNTDAATSKPPDRFGPFRVLHQIGAGALGPVFRAYDEAGDRAVVVKLFQLDVEPERIHRFISGLDALIAAGLKHPAIAAPAAVGMTGASAYLAEEF